MIGLGLTGPLIGTTGRSSFNPSSVTSAQLIHWYDADVTIVTGAGVSQLTDMASGQSATQGTDANRPALVTSRRNGHSAILGASGKVLNATITARAQPFSIYGWGEWSIDGGSAPLFMYGGASSADIRNQAGSPAITAGAVLTSGGASPASGTPFGIRGFYSGASSTIRLEPHGSAVQAATGNPGTGGLTTTLSIMALPGGTLHWAGYFYGALIYLGTVSAADDAKIRAWGSRRWNIVPL